MAKKPKITKKSRFGNPAKAAADAATRAPATPSADARLERAMAALSPGFVDWLAFQARPETSIDFTLAVMDEFFDLYRMMEHQVNPTALNPKAVREVLAETFQSNAMAAMTMGRSVRDYVDYLNQARLWTGSPEDLAGVRIELARPGGETSTDGYRDDGSLASADWEFADVFIPEHSHQQTVETATQSPLWQNALALLEWIGEGRELTAERTLVDSDAAAAALLHSGVGKLAAAATFTTPHDHAEARLALYWTLLDTAGLITVGDAHVRPTPHLRPLAEETEMLMTMRDLMGHFIFLSTLRGSEEGAVGDWHAEMAAWLIQCSSTAPPESALMVQALEEPDTVHPELLAIALQMAHWAEEGLVTVDEFIEVPPAWRPDVVDMLKDDFPVNATGPGAALL